LHEVFVAQIESDRVLVKFNDSEHWIRLGQSVGQVVAPEGQERPDGSDPEVLN
jgi:hypothetical protein